MSADPQQASQFLQQIELWLQELAQALVVDLWGPASALMPKWVRRVRFQLMLRTNQREVLQQLLSKLIVHLETTVNHRLHWSIDVDPVTLD